MENTGKCALIQHSFAVDHVCAECQALREGLCLSLWSATVSVLASTKVCRSEERTKLQMNNFGRFGAPFC